MSVGHPCALLASWVLDVLSIHDQHLPAAPLPAAQYVRAALAGVVMELAPMMGKQGTIDHLVPVFLTLLKDMYPDVRLNVISKLSQVNQVRAGTRPVILF